MKKLLLVSFLLVAYTLLLSPLGGVHAEFLEDDPYVYLNNIDNPVNVETVKYELTVFDEEDGDLTNEIYIVLDNYTGNEDKLGDFLVVYGVTDSGGNETTIAIKIRNVDINAPVFVITAESTLNIPQYSHLASNLPQIKAIDLFEGDITSSISISGLEHVDTDIVGAYDLTYTVSDSSGNTLSQTFMVNVVDSTAPELIGPSEIVKRANYILDGQFFLQYFSATDDHDGIVSNRIEVISDSYMGKANVPGTYQIVLSVSDSQGNYINHSLVIKVVNNMVPNLIIDKYYWEVPNNYLLTDTNFIDTLQFIGDLPNYTYVFTTTYDNYSNFFDTIAKYQKNFSLISSTGNEYEREIILDVVESEFNIVEQDPGFFDEMNFKFIGGAIAIIALIGAFGYGVIKG